ncbi:unnamed protein product [Ilex paraguariensis]|uniref:F-box associated beta-propeller type 1 domain-containing protein n=1 Tax=Ilex paraguariensis TaxID=185542 RepID=A0ABC8R7N9_9AQUA
MTSAYQITISITNWLMACLPDRVTCEAFVPSKLAFSSCSTTLELTSLPLSPDSLNSQEERFLDITGDDSGDEILEEAGAKEVTSKLIGNSLSAPDIKKNSQTPFSLSHTHTEEKTHLTHTIKWAKWRAKVGVSKFWKNLIDSPTFISIHLQHNNDNKDNAHMVVYYHNELRDLGDIVLFPDKTFTVPTYHNMGISIPVFNRLGGPINGVFFLCDRHERIALWNPATRAFRALPLWRTKLFPHDWIPCHCGFGFGFDPTSDDYKVVWIRTFDDGNIDKWDPWMDPIHVAVYTLSTDSWKDFKEDFKEIQGPPDLHQDSECEILTLYNGTIALIYSHSRVPLDAWESAEQSSVTVWVLMEEEDRWDVGSSN